MVRGLYTFPPNRTPSPRAASILGHQTRSLWKCPATGGNSSSRFSSRGWLGQGQSHALSQFSVGQRTRSNDGRCAAWEDSVERLEVEVESGPGVVEVPPLWVPLLQGVGPTAQEGS